MDGFKVIAIQGKTKHEVEVPQDATFKDVKQQLHEAAGMSLQSQKLIFKGKEPKDNARLADSGFKSGEKLMLMLSEAGHKEVAAATAQKEKEEQRRQAAAAQQLKEQMRDGSSTTQSNDDRTRGQVGGTETIAEEGIGELAYTIRVVRGKVHYLLAGTLDTTFGEIKAKLELLAKVAGRNQRLVFKGKERPDSESLAAAGAPAAGAKMLLLLGEAQHRLEDELQLLQEAGREAADVEAAARRLQSKCEHSLIDAVGLKVEMAVCNEAVERLQDNISYLSRIPAPPRPAPPPAAATTTTTTTAGGGDHGAAGATPQTAAAAAAGMAAAAAEWAAALEGLRGRLAALRRLLDDLHNRYVLVARR